MNSDLKEFIEKARYRHWPDEEIKNKLVNSGWDEGEVQRALGGEDDLVVPAPSHQEHNSISESQRHEPIAVAEIFTPRGFEYKIFSVALVVAIFALIYMADTFLYSQDDMSAAAFPLTLLLVTGPLALFMFFRLKHAEEAEPKIRKDPSRRKAIQGIQLVAFLAVLIHTIMLLYMVLSGHYTGGSSYSYDDDTNFVTDFLSWIVTMVVAGGTFLYYWRDEHRPS